MASSDNLTSIETWAFRPSFETPWFSDSFARDTEIFTKVLQQSIASGVSSTTAVVSPFSDLLNSVMPETPSSHQQGHSLSSSGGLSDPETVSKRRKTQNPAPVKGKLQKRRPRASKRSPTTFINADPENFREMVQQVTGVRFSSSGQFPVGSVVKPEPQRVVNRLQTGTGCLLPTLDTSAFLLDHQQQVATPVAVQSSAAATEGGAGGFDFEGFANCFPTLESWKVM